MYKRFIIGISFQYIQLIGWKGVIYIEGLEYKKQHQQSDIHFG